MGDRNGMREGLAGFLDRSLYCQGQNQATFNVNTIMSAKAVEPVWLLCRSQ